MVPLHIQIMDKGFCQQFWQKQLVYIIANYVDDINFRVCFIGKCLLHKHVVGQTFRSFLNGDRQTTQIFCQKNFEI
jgi:hypothetical protein